MDPWNKTPVTGGPPPPPPSDSRILAPYPGQPGMEPPQGYPMQGYPPMQQVYPMQQGYPAQVTVIASNNPYAQAIAVQQLAVSAATGSAGVTEDHRSKARGAHSLMLTTTALSFLALSFSISSMSEKWLSISTSVYSIVITGVYSLYSETVCTTIGSITTCQDGTRSISGAVFVFPILTILSLTQGILAFLLSLRIQRTAKGSYAQGAGCCVSHAPAVVGLAWTCVVVSIIGYAVGRSYFNDIDLSSYTLAWQSGHNVAIINVFITLASAILASIVDARLKEVPGLGRPKGKCCACGPATVV